MMEFQERWLTCKRKSKVCLLAHDEKAFYEIEVVGRLDYATEEWLYQQGVSEELLKELHLNYQCYPKTDIRGVAIGGSMAGDMVCLYSKTGNRCNYFLELDYDMDFLELFFGNIPRFQPPKKPAKNKNTSWREAQQDPELFERLKYVSPACLIASICAACGYILTAHWTWFTLCLICLAVQFGLLTCMPAYFTIALPKGAKKQKVWELELPLLALFCILIFRNHINLLSDGDFWITLLIGAGAGLLLYLFLEDLQSVKWGMLCAVMIGALSGMLLIGQANQVYDFSQKDCFVLEVEDLHSSSGRRGRNYYCGVTLPDGREVSLNISRSLYNSLTVGDMVQVERGDGAFGMEYANAKPLD